MAKEKGFYNDVGLDVEIREFKVGKLPVDEVKKGNANFGIARSDLIQDRLNKNINYLQLLALCQASPVMMQTIKKYKIEKIEDIKGKKLLVYDDIVTASISSMLYSAGIKRNDLGKNLWVR